MSILKKRTDNRDTASLDRFRQKKSKRWLFIISGLFLGLVTWYVATLFIAIDRITVPNVSSGSSFLKNATRADAGPINVLLIGIGGANHPGGTLADSIMVASLDPKHKTVSLLSLPRDLYVTIPGHGRDKINVAHSFGESSSKQKGGGPALTKQVVSETLDVPIHYFIRLDFDGFKKIVDTLGGVQVDVKTAIHDPLFPDEDMKGYDPFSVKAGLQKMNGETALKYARSRETSSDFDRARRQQEIIVAIKDKLLSAQVLANPKKVTDIITVVGNHLQTDFSTSEIEDLVKLAKQFDQPNIRSQVVGSSENNLVISGRSAAGASIQIPRAGINDFSEIQRFAEAYFAQPAIKAENATITLEQAGASKSVVAKLAEELETAGFTVEQAESASSSTTTTALYDRTDGKKPISLKFLTSSYNLKATKEAAQGEGASAFRLVVGSDFAKVTKASPSPKTASQRKTSWLTLPGLLQ